MDGYPEEEEEERDKCAYCGDEDSVENPVFERKYTVFSGHYKEMICKTCLSEVLAEENEKIKPCTSQNATARTQTASFQPIRSLVS